MDATSRRKLLAWYRRRRRDLPWRRTRDPYAIWVSEIMLQQTRVAAVVPYYERFLRRFPDVGTLARARIDTVLTFWSGLGYYRRARSLHAAAKVVRREGGLPRAAAGWRRLPGVGPYTAAAVASIAFGEPVAAVDGNVTRVLSRLHAL
ncbi:MAG: HhH-GPD family protein, partial [Planctomycetota bacterium]